MNFKVGQMVICITNSTGGRDVGEGSGWKIGKSFIINKITYNNPKILWPEGGGSGVFENYVKHATWKERYKG